MPESANPNENGLQAKDEVAGASRQFQQATVFISLCTIVALTYATFGDALTLENLAEREATLRDVQSRFPILVFGGAFLIYVLVTGLSLPGAVALSLVLGWYFGFLPAFILVSFASTTGAMVAFMLSRYFFREAYMRRFGDRLISFNKSLKEEGPFFLFTLRMIPAFPFFVINAVMGLTPIRARTFWWVSQLGMLPGTAVFVYAGSRVPDLATLSQQGINAVFSPRQLSQMLIAFGLIGIFPLIVRYVMKRYVMER